MQELNSYLKERHQKFWFDIYNTEQNEIKSLKDYLDYIKENINITISNQGKTAQEIEKLFLKKHLDYIDEAFSSLILGNQNAFASIARIMLENYVSFCLIKKYHNKKLWLNWFLWSNMRVIEKITDEEAKKQLITIYNRTCKELKVPTDFINNTYSYGWLSNMLKHCNFKEACKLLDKEESKEIYKDFSYLSDYVHNSDIYTKISFLDLHHLAGFIEILYRYTDKFIHKSNYHLTTRKEYRFLSLNVYQTLNECLNNN